MSVGGNLHGIVLLDSPGGKVVASMELGQAIRRLGMAVIVARPAAASRRRDRACLRAAAIPPASMR